MAALSLEAEAKEWLSQNVNEASLSSEIGSRRLNVAAPCGSFYISPPENPGDPWTVWSDDENKIQIISDNLDYLTAANRTITEILSRTIQLFQTAKTSCDTESSDSECESSDGDDDDDDEGMYDYYEMEDEDAVKEKVTKIDDEISADDFFTGDGSPAAVHRLLADLKNMAKSGGKFGITGAPRQDNLFLWDVQLFDFNPQSLLHIDLLNYAKMNNRKPAIEMEMKFPKDYPMNPPFVRILRPRFKFLTGHVTIGGSVCMQMLTRSGWSPSNDIESILVQVRAEIMSDLNARLDLSVKTDYSESEARQAFERMVHRYGWNK